MIDIRSLTRRQRIGAISLALAIVVGLAAAAGFGAFSGGHRAALATTTTVPTTLAPTTTTRPAPPPTAPLTGLLQANRAALRLPAVVVKIDNVDVARPQAGINQADIVYEEMVEGGLTRLAAVFQSQYPGTVGPVRSGRLTDEGIIDDLNHPVYVCSGTNAIFLPILRAQPVTEVDDGNHGGLFWREGSDIPHNLFSSVPSLAAQSTTHRPPRPIFDYIPFGGHFVGAGGSAASHISISFPAASASWSYDSKLKDYLRDQNGTVDVDSAGHRVSAQNVVVMFVTYVTTGFATGEGGPPAPIPGGIMTGRGPVWVLSAGRIVKGTWTRGSLEVAPVLRDAAGHVIDLTRGRTWVELVPKGDNPAVTP